MPSLPPGSIRTRIRTLAGVALLAVALFAAFKLFSPGGGVTVPAATSSPGDQAAAVDSMPSGGADSVPGLRLVFAAEELLGKADAASSGAIVLDATGDGHSALLIWSSAGIQLYADTTTPVSMPSLQPFKDVRDVKAADFNSDGLTDLCVITKHRASLLVNGPHGFTALDGGEFPGKYTQALWLDYDHDGVLDLILLGARPVLLRNRGGSRFAPRRGAISFLPGEALAATVIREASAPDAFDFIVSYRNRGGVRYHDRSGGKYAAENLPELPAGATQLRSGEFTNQGSEDFSYLLGENATLVERSGGSWKKVLTVPAGHSYLFGDFTNLGVRDWMAAGLLLAGGNAHFSQSRDMATATASHALVAADFDRDGRLDFAGVAPDGTILRYMNRSDLTSHWLRIRLGAKPGQPVPQGSLVTVQTHGATQSFRYEGNPLHIGMGEFEHASRIGILWPDGAVQTDLDRPTDTSYTYNELPAPVSSAGPGSPPPGVPAKVAPYLAVPLGSVVVWLG